MFYINLIRKLDFKFANKLLELFKIHFCSLNTSQIAIICSGFFKSNNIIRDQEILCLILEHINSVIKDNDIISNVQDNTFITLVLTIIKSLRSGLILNANSQQKCIIFLQNLCAINKTQELPLIVLSHASWLASNLQINDPPFFTITYNKLQTDLSNSRLKEITKIIWCLSNFEMKKYQHFDGFAFNSKDELISNVLKELEKPSRQIELLHFFDHFAVLMYAFSIINVYPLQLLRSLFDHLNDRESFNFETDNIKSGVQAKVFGDYKSSQISRAPDKTHVLFDVLYPLYASFKIERLEFKDTISHPYFDSLLRAHELKSLNLSQRLMQKNSFDSMFDVKRPSAQKKESQFNNKFFSDEIHAQISTLTPTDFQIGPKTGLRLNSLPSLIHILPHNRSPMIYLNLKIMDKFGHHIEKITNSFIGEYLGKSNSLSHLASHPHLVVVPAAYHSYDTSRQLTGKFLAKLRQLRTLKYNVALVSWSEYSKTENKQLYMKQLVSEHLMDRYGD
ncbi:unnamed protein product [Gordionus sp. m RMFG-2023]